jgi:peptidoglycan/xylan/chitin deacetylase (PgdA/CDA1 family)
VPNPSLETVSAGLPANWQKSSWGTNTTRFTYLTTGAHTGTRAVQTKITRYTDGDSKWTFDPITVGSTQQYSFSDWYNATTTSLVYADFGMNDGTDVYTYLGTASTASTWTQFSTTFSVPTGAKTITVFHLLDRIGTLNTDDYSLQAFTPVGFNRAVVSLTFDDGIASTYQNGLPLLQKYGFVSTDYIVSGLLGTPGYMTTAQVQNLKSAGHEIGSHTVTHPDLTTLTSTKLTNELSRSKNTLQTLLGVPVTNFAAPYGAFNSTVINRAKTYYNTLRGVEPGYNAKNNFNAYDLKVQNVDISTTVSQLQGWLAQAQATHTWLILVFHAVDADSASAGQYDVTPTQLDGLLAAVQSSGIAVQTVQQAKIELTPQL